MNKLVAILPSNSRSEVWATLEFQRGRNVLTFREQEAERGATHMRKPKPPLSIPATAIPQLRAALETAEAELRAKGLLPPHQPGQEARRADPATRQGAGDGRA